MTGNVYLMPAADTLTETPEGRAKVGDTIHVRVSGTTMFGRAWHRGDTFLLEADDLAHSVNRHGESFLDRELRNPDGKIGLGPWPEDEPVLLPGTSEHAEAREAARREAHNRPPSERAAALQAVHDTYGPSTPTSRTINRAPHASIRSAADQDQRVRAGAVQAFSPSGRKV